MKAKTTGKVVEEVTEIPSLREEKKNLLQMHLLLTACVKNNERVCIFRRHFDVPEVLLEEPVIVLDEADKGYQ